MFCHYCKLLLEYSTQCPLSYKIFQSSWWAQTLFSALYEFCILFPLIPLHGSILILGWFLYPHLLISVLLNIWGSTSANFPEFSLCTALSFLVLCAVNSNCFGLPRFSVSSLWHRYPISYFLLLDVPYC